ncbi:MAG: hydroxymethylbilane synthase [Gammaproteobacteria bacterium]|nr:hydroxymethylbilane synthase [Gammaproteobacteria bacterium]
MKTIAIATRKSALALHQADMAARALQVAYPELEVEVLPISTRGDEIGDRALAPLGGKGLFVSALERALATGRAQLAVHSLKDVPSELASGFTLSALLARADPRDALIARDQIHALGDLGCAARVGTASLRRQAQLLHARPDLDIRLVRGSVETRLARLDAGELDAVVLAAAGLERLGIERGSPLDPAIMLPASGQGAIAIEARLDDTGTTELAAVLDDRPARLAATAERAFCRALGATCTSPVGALATLRDDDITLAVRVLPADGSDELAATRTAPAGDAEALGKRLARELLARGAGKWLECADAGPP